eukprot:gene640-1233_t
MHIYSNSLLSGVLERISLIGQSVTEFAQTPEVSDLIDNVLLISKNVSDMINSQLLYENFEQIDPRYIYRDDYHSWETLGNDTLRQIVSYLHPKEACYVQVSCAFSRATFIDGIDSFWINQLSRRLPGSLPTCRYAYAKYVEDNNLELESEIQHIQSVSHIYEAIQQCKTIRIGNIIGMICDLIWFADERIARTMSKKRFMAMRTIITRTEQDVLKVKRVTECMEKSPKSFLSYENATRNQAMYLTEQTRILTEENNIPGFIGYVVNLVKLRKEHEYLRMTVIWSLFRDMMVFESTEAKLSYKSLLEPESMKDFWGVGLNDYSDEELQTVQPSFQYRGPRDLSELAVSPKERISKMERQLENGITSLAIIRYSLC